jgi:hypothetical protein
MATSIRQTWSSCFRKDRNDKAHDAGWTSGVVIMPRKNCIQGHIQDHGFVKAI